MNKAEFELTQYLTRSEVQVVIGFLKNSAHNSDIAPSLKEMAESLKKALSESIEMDRANTHSVLHQNWSQTY